MKGSISPLMFASIAHADWSIAAAKRWVVWARRSPVGWHVASPRAVSDVAEFVAALWHATADGGVLAGFDFPIGLPASYGEATGFGDFPAALQAFSVARGWENFYRVSSQIADVEPRRPFFPHQAVRGVRRMGLWQRLGLPDDAALFRLCERAGGPGLRQACPLFWTVGANQVGRAATAGWQQAIDPAVEAGAALWPFHGSLAALAGRRTLVLAETYPADVYARLGAFFGPRASKRRQGDRVARAPAILAWAADRHVDLSSCREEVSDGFGPSASGEDRFDALVGALGMIMVAEGWLPAMPDGLPDACSTWEGWILGRPWPDPAGSASSRGAVRSD